MRPGHHSVLHHSSDRRSLLFVALTIALLLIPLWLPLPLWAQPVWLTLSSLFCFNACIVNHNHVHTPMFVSSRLNTLFGVVLTLAKGHSSAGVIQAHNDNHHRHQGSPEDWIHPGLAGNGIGILRLFRFILMASLSMARGRRQSTPIDCQLQRDRIRLERLVLAGFIVLLLYLAGFRALIFVGLPWVLGICMLVGVNLLQHDGCEAGNGYRSSRNFTGKFGNWIFFNNGYHTIHHIDPGMHWSQLADAHKRLVHVHIPTDLEQPSILSYLLQHYIIRGADPLANPAQEQA
jgi:fatty acid desaturase